MVSLWVDDADGDGGTGNSLIVAPFDVGVDSGSDLDVIELLGEKIG